MIEISLRTTSTLHNMQKISQDLRIRIWNLMSKALDFSSKVNGNIVFSNIASIL